MFQRWDIDFFKKKLYNKLQLNMEAYRSGHNGTDSKSVVPHGTVGSNPTASASRVVRQQKEARFYIRLLFI